MSTSKPRSAKARAAAFFFGEFGDLLLELVPAFGRVVGGCVHTGHLLRVGAVAPEDPLHRIAHFAHGGAGADGVHGGGQQVAGFAFCYFCNSCQRLTDLRWIAFLLDIVQPRNLRFTHLDVVDIQDVDGVFLAQLVFVDADDHVTAWVMPPMASTSSMIFHAASAMSCVSFSIM